MMQADESQLRDEAAHKKMFQLFNGEREEKSIAIVCSINKLSVSLDRSLVGGFHLTRLEFSNQKVFFFASSTICKHKFTFKRGSLLSTVPGFPHSNVSFASPRDQKLKRKYY